MVYFIQQADSGPIKIGYTDRDIKERLGELQTGNGAELHLLGAIEGTLQTERALHIILSTYKIRGDWFEPAETVLGTIRTFLADKYICVPLDKNNQSEKLIGKISYFIKRPGSGRITFAIIERRDLPDGTSKFVTVRDPRLASVNGALKTKAIDIDAAELVVQAVLAKLRSA